MSTIRVDNFGPSAGGTTYSARGIAKAWVNFNGTGTVAVRDSDNVSSLTDNATGNYLITCTSAFSAADFNSTAGTGISGSATSDFIMPWNTSPTTSTINITTWNGGQAAFLDSEFVSVSLMGDLA